MKGRPALRPLLLVLLATPLVACGGSEGGAQDASVDTVSIADVDVSDIGAEAVARVCGRLLASDGEVVAEHSMIVCDRTACHMGTSVVDGRFCVDVYSAGEFRFHALERVEGGRHYGDVFFPMVIDEQQLEQREVVELGDVILPLISSTASLELASGGSLTLPLGTLDFAPGAARVPTLVGRIDVGIVAVPAEEVHARLGAGDPVAVYLIVPSEAHAAPAATYALVAPEGLLLGETLLLFDVDGESGLLKEVGRAQVDAAGMIVPLDGSGLSSLGWLLFYREGA